jgi:hypothetical protein
VKIIRKAINRAEINHKEENVAGFINKEVDNKKII